MKKIDTEINAWNGKYDKVAEQIILPMFEFPMLLKFKNFEDFVASLDPEQDPFAVLHNTSMLKREKLIKFYDLRYTFSNSEKKKKCYF